jgi:hypothetical protein
MDLLEPKELVVGNSTYRLSKFPCIAGREILAKYPMSNIPKIGDYGVSEETMLKLMCFVEAQTAAGTWVRLTSRELVNNQVKSTTDLITLEKEMFVYNFDFFQGGRILSLLEGSARNILSWIIETLTGSSPQSSPEAVQPTTSSKKKSPSKKRS